MQFRKLEYSLRFFLYQQKQIVLRNPFLRRFILICIFLFHAYYLLVKNKFAALNMLLRYERDVTALVGSAYAEIIHRKFISFLEANISDVDHVNLILDSYAASKEAENIRDIFHSFGEEYLLRMKYPKVNDDPARQGDLIVLKPFKGSNEKGVLFIQYDEGVKKFAALFDIRKLAEFYRLVVEPSTSGYQNAMFFLCYGLPADVIFEAQYEPDYQYIETINRNFHPIRLGAGDWVDPDLFSDGSQTEKKYDVVMIANWLKWKRHHLFFATIAGMRSQIKKVAVIGYPIDGRSLENIRKECVDCGVSDLVDFFERIPPDQVRKVIQQSKTGILLSKEEGANRGIYECFFSNVPVVLSRLNRGVNRDHLNSRTGMLASDKELPEVLSTLLKSYKSFSSRDWALENTGYLNSSKKLNEFIKKLALAAGENWSQDLFAKHNSPHARFADMEDRQRADEAVKHLRNFVREHQGDRRAEMVAEH